MHRLIAATAGTLIIATTVASWLNKNSNTKIKTTSMLAAILVITQITLGAIVIDTKLHAVLVAVHLGIGIWLFAMTLLTTLFAFRIDKPSIKTNA